MVPTLQADEPVSLTFYFIALPIIEKSCWSVVVCLPAHKNTLSRVKKCFYAKVSFTFQYLSTQPQSFTLAETCRRCHSLHPHYHPKRTDDKHAETDPSLPPTPKSICIYRAALCCRVCDQVAAAADRRALGNAATRHSKHS